MVEIWCWWVWLLVWGKGVLRGGERGFERRISGCEWFSVLIKRLRGCIWVGWD